MCGIFAYKGPRKNALELVIQGLQKLEYRGYDSWGIATEIDGQLFVHKQIGKISDAKLDDFKGKPASFAMGHTRWATHGGVTDANAHPHFDPEHTVAVVHNGIIENFEELRAEIGKEHFSSDTDTEVIAHLVAKYRKEGMEFDRAVLKTMDRLKGRYAIVVMAIGEDKLIAARRGSPLIVGVGKDEFFLASDIPAFLEYTQDVKYLDDNEMVLMDGGIEFVNIETRKPVEKRLVNIDWKAESAEKGEYDHFMLKEIMEQKETILRAINQDEKDIMKVVEMIKSARGTFLSGCGTAGKVCMTAEYWFSIIANRHVNFAHSSEFPIYHHFLRPESLLIVVSQSGETADVLEAIEAARKKGSKVLAITNVEGSTIARTADFALQIKAGPEKAVASTKAATSQLALLLLLAYAMVGKLQEGRRVLAEVAGAINDMLNPRFLTYIKSVAETMKDHHDMFIIGKAENYPLALEAAIKIQEVSYVHAQGFAAGELKHGPIALISKGTPCISLIASDEVKPDMISNTLELKARGARIIGISPEKHSSFDNWIRVPNVGVASPLVNIIPIQVLAYYLSVQKGLDPDMPRNLAKSVTVK
jgi:glucosamine--fructose-6-phosphate aminotransferase (isomerizing)